MGGNDVPTTRARAEVEAAIEAAEDTSLPPGDRAAMLTEIAMGLQTRPKSPDELEQAVGLYRRARALLDGDDELLVARIDARLGTALQALPALDGANLIRARDAFEAARAPLERGGRPGEIAELQMNIGLCLQSLAALGKAPIGDAIKAYQRALRTFDKAGYPKEYAILQNNLATAFLSIPFTDQQARMREALAVQSFEDGLAAVNLIDHPSEYAMLQNNLGNALQYASSAHPVANNLRALEAYDEALKVRNRHDTPIEYANTIANKANCLTNLPDNPVQPEWGNAGSLAAAAALLAEARTVFESHGEPEKAAIVQAAIEEIRAGLDDPAVADGRGAGDRHSDDLR
jgi:tetratricopeptide (TPR) repeat protein